MREIKFRAWNLLAKKMMSHEDICYTPNLKMYELFCDTPDNRPWELMQYTGLKDKNGVEIYEGDIITTGSGLNDKFKVEYKINSFIFSIAYYEYTRYLLYLERWQYSKLEVIGNIYENPELLGPNNESK